ncbi:hypothetical protein EVAR_14761_1 [Eumeta japonica]|uniref:Uncharacterized protein n=1 Tax=Eumeta variegata TaxID=151549 RepID=A0A4C1TWR2_EUMVA|nr:hypothetical protein EVAR_14761_1 [Eumeta japonica]
MDTPNPRGVTSPFPASWVTNRVSNGPPPLTEGERDAGGGKTEELDKTKQLYRAKCVREGPANGALEHPTRTKLMAYQRRDKF